VRLDFHLDTDPTGTGRRARWWALILAWASVILAELVLLGILSYAIAAVTR
jgi:hypothetical protein